MTLYMPKAKPQTAIFAGKQITQSVNAWSRTLHVGEVRIRKRLRRMPMQAIVNYFVEHETAVKQAIARERFLYGR